jgi:hypothetical protein
LKALKGAYERKYDNASILPGNLRADIAFNPLARFSLQYRQKYPIFARFCDEGECGLLQQKRKNVCI